ncbi:MAG: hypothetical protein A3E80_04900 [Chlamydiae bacterium RIFCSPHIGHO2_12_FULL_49_9]|nr:MAG: hypothetical protein A3E80_04900 [Chlamydiae bacterium RIFCSPHIGHO2_12_FULL_49_9]
MKIAIAYFVFFSCSLNAFSRNWELWDREKVAQTIDSYWLKSEEEIKHRKAIASLLREWICPNDQILEIGCGSGLIYQQLSSLIPGQSYTGVDISEKMLEIATQRFPEAHFMKEDLYGLSFPDNSFEITAAFEVFGHIDGIEKPISEMFRTTSRLAIFTVWSGPKTKFEKEVIQRATFIRTTFSEEDVRKAVESALKGENYSIAIRQISKDVSAYIISKL